MAGLFCAMKTRLNATVILFIVICITLCGCDIFDATLGAVKVPNHSQTAKVRIYVCGAVEREGYYYAEVGTDYISVLRLAGLLPESILPTLSSSYVDGKITQIIVNYYDGKTMRNSINANSVLIVRRAPVNGLDESVVNKIADYIETYGKLTNKKQLKLALGDDYDANFYKLYIPEKDYEVD